MIDGLALFWQRIAEAPPEAKVLMAVLVAELLLLLAAVVLGMI